MTARTGDNTAFLSTLANGLIVLEALVGSPMALRELAEAVGLPRQKTYRIVHTLIQTGWVDRSPSEDTYSLSPRMWSLGTRSFGLTGLRNALAPTVRALSAEYGETVHLAVYDRGSVVYVDKEEGSHPIHSYTRLGGTAPAYCVATGKILLAHQTPEEWDAVAKGGMQPYTPVTIVEKDALFKELTEVRSRGYAVNRGEWRKGVAGVAVPICSPTGDVIAGLGFSGPADRLLLQQEQLVAALHSSAHLAGVQPTHNTRPYTSLSTPEPTG